MRIAAFVAPQFEVEVDWNTLPTHIRSSAAELKRADLSDVGVNRLEAERKP
jgi:hypothetical protein